MSKEGCSEKQGGKEQGYEVVRIRSASGSCRLCEDYAEREKSKPVAVICCEGACLRGEVARQAANLLCYSLLPDKTVRICLGGAFTKDTGQRALVREAGKVLAVEGCFVNCASRMMSGVITGLLPEVVIADRLYDFDRSLFSVQEMPLQEIACHAGTVARKIAETIS